METVAKKLLDLMAAFGVGVIIVLGAGFWLFHRVKKEAERRDMPPESNKNPPD